MGHEWGAGFDRDVCEGCPKKVESIDADTDSVLADSLLRSVARITGKEAERCGICGCTLAGLARAQAPPSDCPRIGEHTDG